MSTLENQRVRRAGRFLRNTLTKDEMKKFESILAFDQQSRADMLNELSEILGSENMSQSDIERCKDIVATLLSSPAGEDNTQIPAAPSKEQDASTDDQGPPFPGRPLRHSHAVAQDSGYRSPISFFNRPASDSGSEARKRMLQNMARIQLK
jgi:hypothetical protein